MTKHTCRFTSDVVVGQKVTGVSNGPRYTTEWSGIYEGVKASEWDGKPVHFFRDGIIGETPQTVFAMPVDQFVG